MTTAISKLRPSLLPDENRLREQDLDLDSLNLALKGAASVHIDETICDGQVERTIEGASTITIQIIDRERNILNSGRLGDKVDILIDGLWFRLVRVEKRGIKLILTFEDREVAILRLYRKPLIVKRGKMTRERFVERMINEVKEMKIPYVIPALEQFPDKNPKPNDFNTEPAAVGNTLYRRNPGFAPDPRITVRGLIATQSQIDNTDIVLQTGAALNAPRPVMVAAIEVINEESNATNHPPGAGDLDSVGLFQQRAKYYSPDDPKKLNDITFASDIFFRHAIAAYKSDPTMAPEYIARKAQNVEYMGQRIISLWHSFREEAERTVTRWGSVSGTAQTANANAIDPAAFAGAGTGTGGSYSFTRGLPAIVNGVKKIKFESTWDCAGRMADEIQARRFMSTGTFFFISEHQLFLSKPRMKINEDSEGVDNIDFSYDVGHHHSQSDNSHTADVNVECWIHRWDAPPGSTIEIFDMGPLDGRWLVTNVSRPLFSQKGTITLRKPRPRLPEPNLDRNALIDAKLPPLIDHPSILDIPQPSLVSPAAGTSADLAKQILAKAELGFYHDDNGQQIKQLQTIAAGRTLTNTLGEQVTINPKVLGAIMTLLNHNYTIGTYALCTDHSTNVKGGGVSQHTMGEAVDISSVGAVGSGRRVIGDGDPGTTAIIKQVMQILAQLSPWDLICAGNGHFDASVANLQIDNQNSRSGEWVPGHRDHIHVSFKPGARDS